MKKVLSLLAVLLVVVACSAKSESFKGKDYKMVNAMNGAEITLGFSAKENRFFGQVVNRYFGSYTQDGNKITFGPAGSTMMMGPEPLMEAENQYLRSLPDVKTFAIDGKKLTLKMADGKELVFEETGTIQE